MTTTPAEQAAALRKLAFLLTALADDVESGYAVHVSGEMSFDGETVFDVDRSGPVVKDVPAASMGKLPMGNLTITSDLEFQTGQYQV